jgi:Fe-S oxidoreductase/nitrate reductase gamma subunit
MEFARPIMWNVPRGAEIALYALVPLVATAFLAGVVWRVRKWFLGQAEPGTPAPGRQLAWAVQPKRLGKLVRTALFQARLAPDGFSLLMHQAMFWGMVFLFIGTVLAAIDQHGANLLFGRQFLSGRFYLLFEFVLDVFGVVLIAGVAMAACRRYILRPARLQAKRTATSLWDAFPFLTLLGLIAVTGFLVEGLRIAEGFSIENEVAAAVAGRESKQGVIARLDLRERLYTGSPRQEAELTRIAGGGAVFPAGAAAPVGYALANAFASLPLDCIRLVHQLLWWIHAVLAFGLIAGIPFTKAFHFISSPANLLFRHLEPAGRLPVLVESGVRSVRDYMWRQLLQVDACTWCGKCQDVCPAYHVRLGLSPRDFVQSVGARLLRTRRTDDERSSDLHGEVISAEELWACCTCGACETVCPVQVQPPRLIIDMRRHLVDRGQIDEGLQVALTNFQRYGNSFGQPARKRPDWTKTLGFPIKDARREPVDYLWFVGDFASYDPRAQQATQAIAKVLQRAGVDAGLLMETEQNSGNDVRRIGEEGLFAMLRDKNGKELERAKFRRVLTSDPHAFNTLKNEYSAHGDGGAEKAGAALAGKPVVHYAQLLDELIGQGRLRPARPLNWTVTYHDPCYLGRYNGVYDAPRRVLQALGAHLTEMPRNRCNSFCCGAGGGRLWMQDAPGIVKRPAENRIEEALALPGVQCLVVACPKDLMMFHDAIQSMGAAERLRLADLGELVYESLDGPNGVESSLASDIWGTGCM